MSQSKNARLSVGRAAANQERTARLALRTASIEQAVAAVLDSRGYPRTGNTVTIEGETLRFWVYQPDRRTRAPLKRGDFGYRSSEVVTKQVLVPSGRLVLVVQLGLNYTGGRRWQDQAKRPLESCVPAIVAEMEAMARRRIEDRIERERRAEKGEAAMCEAAKRYRRDLDEAGRPDRLQAIADDWHRAERLRAFLDALTARLGSSPPGALAPWLSWARAHVASIDPLCEAGIAELADYAGIFVAPEDRCPIDEEEQYWRDAGLLDAYLCEPDVADDEK